MLNDDEMWKRRAEEHQKYSTKKYETEVILGNTELSEKPIVDTVNFSINKETQSAITPLTRITPDQRQGLLYSIYKEAINNVEALNKQFNASEKDKLVSEESDKLLKIWINNH